jgi:hypothetical protein
MNHTRILLLLATLGAATLAACGSANPPVPNSSLPSSTAKPTTNASPATRGSAAVKAFIDPATGELRDPTEAELKAAATAPAAGTTAPGTAGTQVAVPIVGKAIGNGMVEYDLGKRGMIDEVACVQADGSVSGNCPKSNVKVAK